MDIDYQANSRPCTVNTSEDCRRDPYLDDGLIFAYRRGASLRQNVRCAQTDEAISLAFDARVGNFRPWWTRMTVVIHGWMGATANATLGGRALTALVDAKAQTVTVDIADQSRVGALPVGR